MNTGREIVAEVLRSRTLKPYLEAGLTAGWLTDKGSRSEMVFDGEDLRAYEALLAHWKKHRSVQPDLFRKDFPAASYRLPDTDYTAAELIESAQTEVRGGIVSTLVEDLVDMHDVANFTGIQGLLSGTTKTLIKGIKDSTETAVDIADDFDLDEELETILEMGIPLGLDLIDNEFMGIQPTMLATIVGRQKAGKSTLMLLSAYKAWEMGYDVLFYSVELSRKFLRQRLYSIGAHVSPDRYRKGTLKPDEKRRVREFHKRMQTESVKFKIVKKSSMVTMDDIEGDVKRYRPHVVYVDGFYFMLDRQTKKSAGSDWMAHENVDADLHALAMEEDIPIIVSTQAQEKQQGSKKDQEGGIEARTIQGGTGLLKASDLVLGYNKNGVVNVMLNRYGWAPDVTLTWDWETMTPTVVEYVNEDEEHERRVHEYETSDL